MDLSKVCDCLPHDLLTAKLEAYGLDTASLSLLKNYSANCDQRIKVNYSSRFEFIRGIPQGSILSSFFCNIFINDVFFEMIIRCIFVAKTYKLLLKTFNMVQN